MTPTCSWVKWRSKSRGCPSFFFSPAGSNGPPVRQYGPIWPGLFWENKQLKAMGLFCKNVRIVIHCHSVGDTVSGCEFTLRFMNGPKPLEVSDLDKIYLQLCLDVDTFSSMASATAGSKPEGLQKLTEAVSGIRRTAT